MRTGLRDVRFVIFDNGTRMLFATAFETDWDTTSTTSSWSSACRTSSTGRSTSKRASASWPGRSRPGLRSIEPGDPKLDEIMKGAGAEFKQILQGQQVPAETYDNFLGPYTMPQVAKAARVDQAFQQVLDDPAGAAALQAAPALKPLLDQAAS